MAVGIHLPNEAQWMTSLIGRLVMCRRRGRLRRRLRDVGDGWRRLGCNDSTGRRFASDRRALDGGRSRGRLRIEGQRQDGRRIPAETLQRDRTVTRLPAGAAGGKRLRRCRLDAEGGQFVGASKPLRRRRGRMEERAVGSENRERPFPVGKQPAHPLAKGRRRSGRLGGDDENSQRTVCKDGARAGASKRAAEAGPEPA